MHDQCAVQIEFLFNLEGKTKRIEERCESYASDVGNSAFTIRPTPFSISKQRRGTSEQTHKCTPDQGCI